MSSDSDEDADSTLLGELSELGSAITPILRRLPGARKAIEFLTDGLAGTGANALKSRFHRYRTNNLVTEARQVADATGLPVPVIFDKLVRQRRIDELTMDALRHIGEHADVQGKETAEASGNQENIADSWFQTFYDEASIVDEENVREAFMRILAGEIQAPGSFSTRTMRVLGAVNQSTAEHFRRAASVSVQLTHDGKHVVDARIPAIGGALGQNCLQKDGLSYDVLIDMTESGLLHSDYGCQHPYGPLGLPFSAQSPQRHLVQIPFVHQSAKWQLIPKANPKEWKPLGVVGAKLTSCGVELLKIVDIEDLPNFTAKLSNHFEQSGYQMSRAQ